MKRSTCSAILCTAIAVTLTACNNGHEEDLNKPKVEVGSDKYDDNAVEDSASNPALKNTTIQDSVHKKSK
jgi:hypothetical protein